MTVAGSRRAQRGATLIVGLIMLVLLTLVATAAFMLSTGNLKAVGNMQFRNEAIAAANMAIEQVISSPFTNAPAAESINVDINNDGTVDYVVAIATPVCVRASVAGGGTPSSLSLAASLSSAAVWNTVWDINATVSDAVTGTSVRVLQGVRVLLGTAEKNVVCP